MVMADKNSIIGRSGKRSRGPSPNYFPEDSDNSDQEPDKKIRVGPDYQAEIPSYNPEMKYDSKKDAMLIWAPSSDLSEAKMDEYTTVAKEKHGYNTEQALGMLYWHKHNVDRALADLANFTPYPDEWTVEDKVLFEQAITFHGKKFHRISQMLPEKSVPSLVKYFYSWKKTKSRTSLIDRHAKKRTRNGQDGDHGDAASDASSGSAHDVDMKEEEERCRNCRLQTQQLHVTSHGSLCSPCYQHWRRTGEMRSAGPRRHESLQSRHNAVKHKRRPPKGMHLDRGDLHTLVTSAPAHIHTLLKVHDSDVVSLKRQVQNNKQMLSVQKHKLASGVDDFRPAPLPQKVNSRWTNEELLLAVQGVRKYGRDFGAIAEVIGNKADSHVRSFFSTFRRRYNLDEVLAEHEAEHGAQVIISDHEDTAPDDQSSVPSSLPASAAALLLGQEVKATAQMDGRDGAIAAVTAVSRAGSHMNGTAVNNSSSSNASSHPLPPPLLPQSAPLMPGLTAAIPPSSTASTAPSSSARLAVPQKTVLQQPPPLIRPPATAHSAPLPPHSASNHPLH